MSASVEDDSDEWRSAAILDDDGGCCDSGCCWCFAADGGIDSEAAVASLKPFLADSGMENVFTGESTEKEGTDGNTSVWGCTGAAGVAVAAIVVTVLALLMPLLVLMLLLLSVRGLFRGDETRPPLTLLFVLLTPLMPSAVSARFTCLNGEELAGV